MSDKIKIITDTIALSEVQEIANNWYKIMVKGVVDIRRGVIALGGEWYMDANNALLADGSKHENVWGFNIRFKKEREDTLEYTSLINIRPLRGNTSMEIKDKELREDIRKIVGKRIPDLKL